MKISINKDDQQYMLNIQIKGVRQFSGRIVNKVELGRVLSYFSNLPVWGITQALFVSPVGMKYEATTITLSKTEYEHI